MGKTTEQEDRMDMGKMMDTYKKLAEPGPPHKLLASLAGTWEVRTRVWMEAGAPPMEGNGTCEQKMILGGRYLFQEFTFDDATTGEKVSAINLVGFDNHTGKYVSTWIDSMNTGIYYFEGSASTDGKIITQECSYDHPLKGPCIWRSLARIQGDDTLKYETYLIPEGGKEEKMSMMTLTRRR